MRPNADSFAYNKLIDSNRYFKYQFQKSSLGQQVLKISALICQCSAPPYLKYLSANTMMLFKAVIAQKSVLH